MKSLEKFHKKLIKENKREFANDYSIREAISKDLAKEDSLSFVSEFVKDIKKKFTDKNDRLEILNDISKTLAFYINEIENTTSTVDIMSVSSGAPDPISFDDIVSNKRPSFSDDDDGDEEIGRRRPNPFLDRDID